MNSLFDRFLSVMCVVAWGVIPQTSIAPQAPPATSGATGGVVAGSRGRAVPAPPYSADLVMVTTQTLADGTIITRRGLLKKYRDSQGRTREEDFRNRPGDRDDIPINVIIVDPVAGVRYQLNPGAHTAFKTELRPHTSPLPADTTPAAANRPSAPPRPAMEREGLGTQDFEGVTAKGTRTTITVPAGAEGNDRPIQYTEENWYSDELRAQVLHITKDPRVGEVVTRLTNINLTEPPAELFQVPSDYTIMETQTVASPPAEKE